MDSMKASLRLMRSSRSISYWDLGAAGMFDGILIDERGAVCGEKPARGAGELRFKAAKGAPIAAQRAVFACSMGDSVRWLSPEESRVFEPTQVRTQGRLRGCESPPFSSLKMKPAIDPSREAGDYSLDHNVAWGATASGLCA